MLRDKKKRRGIRREKIKKEETILLKGKEIKR